MEIGLSIAREVAGVRRLLAPLIDRPDWHRQAVSDQIEAMAAKLYEAHRAGDAAMATVLHSWHPTLVCASTTRIMEANLSMDECLAAVAREHGFSDFPSATGIHREAFERAVDALVHGDLAALKHLLAEEPDLVTTRSAFGHRSTLLHYVGSNGVET
jgi:hypothetical protein